MSRGPGDRQVARKSTIRWRNADQFGRLSVFFVFANKVTGRHKQVEQAMQYLLLFLMIYLFIAIFGYFIPAGVNYWLYFVRKPNIHPIQVRRPKGEQMVREIRLSLMSIAIFSLVAMAGLELYKAGWTRIYWQVAPYPPLYFLLSIFLCMVLHDTYFYWTHRFMHWRPVFKYLHAEHHRSVSPTPWAIFAFSPGEAVIQIAVFVLIVIVIPLHPLAFLTFLFLDTQMNTGGHTGYELIPPTVANHWLYQGFNTVSDHDHHHTNLQKNFGSFFNVWDRWMGTFLESRGEAQTKELVNTSAAPRRAASDRQLDLV